MYREPDFSERLTAQADARRSLVQKLKPKPAIQADELIPWDEREAQRIKALIERPRPKKAKPAESLVTNVQMPPATSMADEVTQAVVVPFADPVRYSVEESVEFDAIVCVQPVAVRRKAAAKHWRIREWRDGNRNCHYCGVKTVLGAVGKGRKAIARQNANPPYNLATVDHKEPLTLGGDDAAWNWVIACWSCNNQKGSMTEAEFMAHRLAAE